MKTLFIYLCKGWEKSSTPVLSQLSQRILTQNYANINVVKHANDTSAEFYSELTKGANSSIREKLAGGPTTFNYFELRTEKHEEEELEKLFHTQAKIFSHVAIDGVFFCSNISEKEILHDYFSKKSQPWGILYFLNINGAFSPASSPNRNSISSLAEASSPTKGALVIESSKPSSSQRDVRKDFLEIVEYLENKRFELNKMQAKELFNLAVTISLMLKEQEDNSEFNYQHTLDSCFNIIDKSRALYQNQNIKTHVLFLINSIKLKAIPDMAEVSQYIKDNYVNLENAGVLDEVQSLFNDYCAQENFNIVDIRLDLAQYLQHNNTSGSLETIINDFALLFNSEPCTNFDIPEAKKPCASQTNADTIVANSLPHQPLVQPTDITEILPSTIHEQTNPSEGNSVEAYPVNPTSANSSLQSSEVQSSSNAAPTAEPAYNEQDLKEFKAVIAAIEQHAQKLQQLQTDSNARAKAELLTTLAHRLKEFIDTPKPDTTITALKERLIATTTKTLLGKSLIYEKHRFWLSNLCQVICNAFFTIATLGMGLGIKKLITGSYFFKPMTTTQRLLKQLEQVENNLDRKALRLA